MQFHPSTVTLGDHPLKGIPIGTRRNALLACQETAPGFYLTLIEGVALRAHLEDDHIHAVLLQLVQLVGQRLLHLLRPQALKLSVHTLNPRPAELTLLCLSRHRQQEGQAPYHRLFHHIHYL